MEKSNLNRVSLEAVHTHTHIDNLIEEENNIRTYRTYMFLDANI